MIDLAPLLWPADRLGEAVALAARSLHVDAGSEEGWPVPAGVGSDRLALDRWVVGTARRAGLEAAPGEALYPDFPGALLEAGWAVAAEPVGEGAAPRFLLLAGRRGRRLRVVGPDRSVESVDPASARSLLCREAEERAGREIGRVLAAGGLEDEAADRARGALLDTRLANLGIGRWWRLAPPPEASFVGQLRAAGLAGRLGALLAAYTAQFGLYLLAWSMLGRGALGGRFDRGWFQAWVLVLFTIVPLRMFATRLAGGIAIDAGALLKRRLLAGALALEPDEVRRQGSGGLLGRVFESAAVESLSISGGLLAILSVVELALAGAVLASGAGGALHAGLLAGWVAGALGLGALHLRRRARWTDARVELSGSLIERMIGHRTRLAQESPERRHEGEDEALEGYLDDARSMDRLEVPLALVPRAWLVAAVALLAPSFAGRSPGIGSVAVAIGGMVLAHGALSQLGFAIRQLAGARLAWRQVAPLFHAAPRRLPSRSSAPAPAGPARPGDPLLDAHDVSYRYPGRTNQVLEGVDLGVRVGDRLLLEGPSGAGKSTLGAILCGLRRPSSGLLLLEGLDLATLGADGWRRRIAASPQFHENHVLTGTFAFNLLLGREGTMDPPSIDEAEEVCRDLGLAPLLSAMPAGLLQTVGETGWQLSHGERSRLYIARSLLQGADLVVLDESFAALDPENLRATLRAVLARTRTLLVVAHP